MVNRISYNAFSGITSETKIMDIIEFNSEKAKLNLTNSEITIFINAITKIVNSIPEQEFRQRINLSQKNTIALKDKLNSLLKNNQSETSEFTYRQVLALNSSLNEICYRIDFLNFKEEIGYNIQTVKTLSDLIFPLTEKMLPDTFQVRMIRRTEQLFQVIHPYIKELPRSSQTRKECNLSISEYQILFLLFSLKNNRNFSGIQILVLNKDNHILFKTIVQRISISTLGDIISYFDEYIDLSKRNKASEKYILSGFNLNQSKIFEFQIQLNDMILEKKEFLDLSIKLNISKEKENEKYFEIQAPVNFDNIDSFTSAIKEYLVNTVKCESDQSNKEV